MHCGVGWTGLVCPGLVWPGLVWSGLIWRGLAWSGLAWSGLAWCGLAWSGLARCGLAWSGLAWCGLAWSGLAWCGLACPCNNHIAVIALQSPHCNHCIGIRHADEIVITTHADLLERNTNHLPKEGRGRGPGVSQGGPESVWEMCADCKIIKMAAKYV